MHPNSAVHSFYERTRNITAATKKTQNICTANNSIMLITPHAYSRLGKGSVSDSPCYSLESVLTTATPEWIFGMKSLCLSQPKRGSSRTTAVYPSCTTLQFSTFSNTRQIMQKFQTTLKCMSYMSRILHFRHISHIPPVVKEALQVTDHLT